MRIYSVCCTHCHAGWNKDKPGGNCPRCKRELQTRGSYLEIDLSKRTEDPQEIHNV